MVEVPSESHSYWVESSGSLPDVRPLPADSGAGTSPDVPVAAAVLECDPIRNKGRFRLVPALDEVSVAVNLRRVDFGQLFRFFFRGGALAREPESVEGAVLRYVEKACRVDATVVLDAKSNIDFGQPPVVPDVSSFVPPSHARHEEAPVLATSFRIRFTSDGSGISTLLNEVWVTSFS